MNNTQYVKAQYQSTENLEVRSAVWRPDVDGREPQDVAVEAIRGVAPKEVLEVGAGRGSLAKRIVENVSSKVVAIDSSSAMVDASRALGVESLVADVRELPFPDNSFDVVVAAWMLYHVNPLERAFSEIVRVLRPGGRLVAITNGREHLAELWSLVGERHLEPPFSRENGVQWLETVFTRVQRHDVATHAVFQDRGVAGAYLASVDRLDLVARLPEDGWPRSMPGATSVFVADLV